ncbi:MAG: hypothetical protein ACYCVN_14300 [Acidimicrobiales bacterium]
MADPYDERIGAWLAKEIVRTIRFVDGADVAGALLDNAIDGNRAYALPVLRTIGRNLSHRREQSSNLHRTGAPNGQTEGLDCCARQINQSVREFVNFGHYRLGVLLHAGAVRSPTAVRSPSITATHPQGSRKSLTSMPDIPAAVVEQVSERLVRDQPVAHFGEEIANGALGWHLEAKPNHLLYQVALLVNCVERHGPSRLREQLRHKTPPSRQRSRIGAHLLTPGTRAASQRQFDTAIGIPGLRPIRPEGSVATLWIV